MKLFLQCYENNKQKSVIEVRNLDEYLLNLIPDFNKGFVRVPLMTESQDKVCLLTTNY